MGLNQYDHPYLRRQRVTLNERFLYRRERHRILSQAALEKKSNAWKDLEEGHTDFGFETDCRKIKFAEWKQDLKHSLEAYELREGSVFYRGCEFRPGDVVLSNRTDDSDGIFTTLVEGEQSFAHAAMYVLLESSERLYPTVIEIHHEGVRAVPLKVYLSDKFISYVETYRPQGLTAAQSQKINHESLKLIHEVHGFSIYMEENQDRYLSCAMTVSLLLERSGFGAVKGKSRYSHKTERNLKILGVDSCANRDLLMPDDFAKSEKFSLAGAIDNGRFFEVTARMLARERIRHYWQTKTLKRRRFPLSFPIAWMMIKCIQKKYRRLSPALAGLIEFTPDNFPSGPATFIALTPLAEDRMKKASVQIAQALKENYGGILEIPSLEDLHASKEIQELVDSALSEFRRFY